MRKDEALHFATHLEEVHGAKVELVLNAASILRERKLPLPAFCVHNRAWLIAVQAPGHDGWDCIGDDCPHDLPLISAVYPLFTRTPAAVDGDIGRERFEVACACADWMEA